MITPQFIQSCQSGDHDAVETLVRTHQRAVFQLALSVIDDGAAGSPSPQALHEAEAATRETFVTALDRLGKYREETPFEPWLYRIAVQVSQRRYRLWRFRRGIENLLERARTALFRKETRTEEYPSHAADPRYLPGDSELWSAVRTLPENLRLAVVLRYYHDMPIDEIARVLGTREGAVHARLDAARERIARARGAPESAD